MEMTNALKDLQMKTANIVHRTLLAVSGRRIGNVLISMPVVQLHTTGRTSGKRRSVMLTAPIHDDDRYVVVASKGGDDRHPEWYRNLVANPEVELTIDGSTRPYAARTATAEEKAEMWPQVVAANKGYANYQTKTTRDIPLVICTPRSITSPLGP